MAVVTITGDITGIHGQEIELTAGITDDDGNTIAETDIVSYYWSVDRAEGIFTGSTNPNTKTATYIADINGNAETIVTITCKVEISTDMATPPLDGPYNQNTAAAVGLTGIVVNGIAEDSQGFVTIQDFTDDSDVTIEPGLDIDRVQIMISGSLIKLYRDETPEGGDSPSSMSSYWGTMNGDGDARDSKSLFIAPEIEYVTPTDEDSYIIFEFRGTAITQEANGSVEWDVASLTGIVGINAASISLFTIVTAAGFNSSVKWLVVIADTDSFGGVQTEFEDEHIITISPNQPPVPNIDNITSPIRLGESREITVTITDSDTPIADIEIAWQLRTPSGGIVQGAFDNENAATTNLNAPTAGVQGEYTLSVTVTDTNDIERTDTTTITINDPPTIDSITGVPNAVESGETIELVATVIDPEDTINSYEFVIESGGGTITSQSEDTNNTKVFRCLFKAGTTSGNTIIKFTATDAQGESASNTVTIYTNTEPTIILTVSGDDTIANNETTTLRAVVTDDDTISSYTWGSSDSASIFTNQQVSGNIYTATYNPGSDQGEHTITFTATDVFGATRIQTTTLIVNTDAAIIITGVPNALNPGDTVQLTAIVTDIGDTIESWDWNIISGGGTLSGKVQGIENNIFHVTFTAGISVSNTVIRFESTDAQDATAQIEVTIYTNIAPTIILTVSGDDTIANNETTTLRAVVTDDDTISSYTWGSSDSASIFTNQQVSGNIYTATYNPGSDQGEHTITFTATDVFGATRIQTTTLIVNTDAAIIITGVPNALNPGDTVQLTAIVTDIGDTIESWDWNIISGGGTLSGKIQGIENIFYVTFTAGISVGNTVIRFESTDAQDATAQIEVTIYTNIAPTIILSPSEPTINDNETVVITAVVTDDETISSYQWLGVGEYGTFGPTTVSGNTYTVTYTPKKIQGRHIIRFTATDEHSTSKTESTHVNVNSAPVITLGTTFSEIRKTETNTISASVEDDTIDESTLNWEIIEGDGILSDETGNIAETSSTIKDFQVTYTPPNAILTFPHDVRIQFTIADDNGYEATEEIKFEIVQGSTILAINISDSDNVAETILASLRFDNFVFPATFKLTSVRTSRRITQSPIQRAHGVTQQTTYENTKEISIEGVIHEGQLTIDDKELSLEEVKDHITGHITTPNDRELSIRPDRYYKARLRSSDVRYTPNTNRTHGTLSLGFIASDPHQYADIPKSIDIPRTSSTTISASNAAHEEIITNNGNTDTPLKITVIITDETRSLYFGFYEDPNDSNHKYEFILDSPDPGENAANNAVNYYQIDDHIVIDSAELEVALVNDDGKKLIYHHVRTPAIGNKPIKNLPILIPPGNTKLEFKPLTSGEIELNIEYHERWI